MVRRAAAEFEFGRTEIKIIINIYIRGSQLRQGVATVQRTVVTAWRCELHAPSRKSGASDADCPGSGGHRIRPGSLYIDLEGFM